jgi:hypothetical protein
MNEVQRFELPEHLQTALQRRDWICGLEETILKVSDGHYGDSPDCPLVHNFAGGMYVREIFIPAGKLLTGKIHKHVHPNFLMEGDISIITEDGGLMRMQGPKSIISPAGCKRVILTHTPTWWITVHLNPNGHTSFTQEYEDEIVAKDYAQLEHFVRKEIE